MTIDEAKSSIVSIVGEYTRLKKVGANYKGICPLHDEKSPSFVINPITHRFKCFGCGKSGDAIEFIQQLKQVDFKTALEILHIDKPEKVKPKPITPQGHELSTKGLKFFADRKITKATVDHFRITESDAIHFPYFEGTALVNIKSRFPGKKFSMVAGGKLILWNINAIENSSIAYLTEGEPDAMAIHQAGFPEVVSVPNGNNSVNQSIYLKHCSKIFLCGDQDKQGIEMHDKFIEELGRNRCYRVTWPAGCKDANDTLITHGEDGIRKAIIEAKYCGEEILQELTADFPSHIFPEEIQQNFIDIATERNIPINYIYSTALFSVTALSGNMFKTELNGDIKNIMYMLLVGPSGVGKTPAYNVLCGDLIAPHEKLQYESYKTDRKNYESERSKAKKDGTDIPPSPKLRPRMIKGGTMEGIMRHAEYAPAGFGIYYDEGGRMMSSPNAYKKDSSSLDFWNEAWNGKTYFDVRADEERERFVPETSISVLAGMQTDRLPDYFTQEGISSGIAGRFLLTTSGYIPLNEEVDHFNKNKRIPCEAWKEIIIHLFNKGVRNYFEPVDQISIPFDNDAIMLYNRYSSRLVAESNIRRMNAAKDDLTALMLSYDVKLYAYFGRVMIPLAIIADLYAPKITVQVVEDAMNLYKFYRSEAITCFKRLSESHLSGLTPNQNELFEALPDEFTSIIAEKICRDLKLSEKFFYMNFTRVYERGGWIKRSEKGKYYKNR